MTMTAQNSSRKDNISLFIRYGSVGLEMGLCVVIGITAGYYIDKFFHTSPCFTIIFWLFGIAAAAKSMIAIIKNLEKNDEEQNNSR